MAINPKAYAQLAVWGAYNFAPSRPLPKPPGPAQPLSAELEDELARLARTIAANTPTRPSQAGAQPRSTFLDCVLSLNVNINELRAVSYGPLAAPWRTTMLQQAVTPGGTPVYMAITATPYDATGTPTVIDGSPLVDPRSSYAILPGETPNTWTVQGAAFGGIFQLNGPSEWQPAGYYLTLWIDNTASAVVSNSRLFAILELLRGVDLVSGPDLSLLARRPAPLQPPAARTPTLQTPPALRVTTLGVSRIIPWQLLSPALQREYIVNQANGVATQGLSPV